jgi:cellobiose-specific phosphotransferase system component IIA
MQSGAVAKETGEAISAILAAEQSVSADDQAQAVQEINEAIDALSAARDMITRPAGAGGS